MLNGSPNLNRVVKQAIYQLITKYGEQVFVCKLITADTDYKTGVKTANRSIIPVRKAVPMPATTLRKFTQGISYLSASKPFASHGGQGWDATSLAFIFLGRDLPNYEWEVEDWILYRGNRYDVAEIESLEYDTGWLILGKKVKGHPRWAIFEDLSHTMVFEDGMPYLLTTSKTSVDLSLTRIGGFEPTWDWGDGNQDTGDFVFHTYSLVDTHIVSWNADPASVLTLDVATEGVEKFNTDSNWTNLTSLIYYRNYNLVESNTFDTWVNIEIIKCYQCILDSLDTFDTWTSLTDLICYLNNLTSLETFDTWTDLYKLECYGNNITAIDTFSSWTSLNTFNCSQNNISTLNTYPTWTKLSDLGCSGNNIDTIETFDTWSLIRTLSCYSNNLTSLETFDTWTTLRYFYCYDNNLTSLKISDNLLGLLIFYCYDNLLPASEIDDILINLDASGVSNSTFQYQNNPGSSDGVRSPAAATAKASLIAKGWNITN